MLVDSVGQRSRLLKLSDMFWPKLTPPPTGATRFFDRGHVNREVQGQMIELFSVSFVIVAE